MVENDKNLDRLCVLFNRLDDEGKGKLIRLGEELLNSGNSMNDDTSVLEKGVENE